MQFEDFERAAFVNRVMEGMWPYLEATISSALREFLTPIIQAQLPFPVSGFEFEKLTFGSTPFQVRGVKKYALYAGASLSLSRCFWNVPSAGRDRIRPVSRCAPLSSSFLCCVLPDSPDVRLDAVPSAGREEVCALRRCAPLSTLLASAPRSRYFWHACSSLDTSGISVLSRSFWHRRCLPTVAQMLPWCQWLYTCMALPCR